MPEVSVVIPLYNKKHCIARALYSVMNQTVQDFEVIVVDDGSTDEGADIVKSFDDPRIHLVYQENQGVSSARNRGIEVAETEFIAFLDADDELLPEFLETILHLRKLYPDAGLYGTAYEVHFPDVENRSYNEKDGDRLLSSYFGAYVEHGYAIFNSSSFAAPKEVLIRVGGYPIGVRWNEDGVLWGKIALQFPIAYSPKVCSIYNQYTENNSISVSEYVENPFLQYLTTISRDELLNYYDLTNLLEYIDFCRILTISRNIYFGHGSKVRSELSYVTSSRYYMKKNRLFLLSFIPPVIMGIIRNQTKTLYYVKRKVINKFSILK